MTLLTSAGNEWNPTNDSGDGQSGTIIDNAWVVAIKTSIETLIHSTTNPTVTPEDIIDEVVVARNGQASLNAYLATLVATGYLTGASDLGQDWHVIGGRAIKFTDSDVAHGITNEEATGIWGSLRPISGTAGGAILRGISDLDQRGLQIYGINGSATPTLGGLTLTGAKKSGADAAAMAAAEIVMFFSNYTTNMGKFYGDGSLCLLTGGLSVGFDGQPGADEVQVGDAAFKLDLVSSTEGRLQFDTDDYLKFDRSLNTMYFTIGGATVCTFGSAGTVSAASSLSGTALVLDGGTAAQSGAITLAERADPASADANQAYVYAKDNGAGKTQLVVKFQSGAVQVLATEP